MKELAKEQIVVMFARVNHLEPKIVPVKVKSVIAHAA